MTILDVLNFLVYILKSCKELTKNMIYGKKNTFFCRVITYRFHFLLSKNVHSNILQIRRGINYIKPGDIFEGIHRWAKCLIRKNITFSVEVVTFHVLIHSFKSGGGVETFLSKKCNIFQFMGYAKCFCCLILDDSLIWDLSNYVLTLCGKKEY